MGGATVLELAARHSDLVSGIVMVDPAPLIPDALKQALGPLLQAMEAGDNAPRREFIVSGLFLPSDDATLREQIADPGTVRDTALASLMPASPTAAATVTMAKSPWRTARPAAAPT